MSEADPGRQLHVDARSVVEALQWCQRRQCFDATAIGRDLEALLSAEGVEPARCR